jgi:hypothetical protein
MLRIDRGGCGTIRPTETPFEALLSAFVLVGHPFANHVTLSQQLTSRNQTSCQTASAA